MHIEHLHNVFLLPLLSFLFLHRILHHLYPSILVSPSRISFQIEERKGPPHKKTSYFPFISQIQILNLNTSQSFVFSSLTFYKELEKWYSHSQTINAIRKGGPPLPGSSATSPAVHMYSHLFLPQHDHLSCAGQLEDQSTEILQLTNNYISLFIFLAVSVPWSSSRSCAIPSATAAQGQEQPWLLRRGHTLPPVPSHKFPLLCHMRSQKVLFVEAIFKGFGTTFQALCVWYKKDRNIWADKTIAPAQHLTEGELPVCQYNWSSVRPASPPARRQAQN